ncbi:hypothetical protein ABZ476_27185, partial [Streptomyces albogriseolus]|uniref:ATP-binding protein n=1 Tax=Streptomyces albogriseolus TaxID=1887 RepID=UPI00346BCBCA
MSGIYTEDVQRRCVLPFEALPSEVRLLRRAAATQLSQWGMPTAADAAQLVVTELATNVIKHVGEGSAATRCPPDPSRGAASPRPGTRTSCGRAGRTP